MHGSACVEQELCDGVDNDADRLVDEGFPDLDADGTADCVDLTCDLADVTPTMVPIDKTCLHPDVVIKDPWNAVIEYQFKDGSYGSWSAPVVGQLTDDKTPRARSRSGRCRVRWGRGEPWARVCRRPGSVRVALG